MTIDRNGSIHRPSGSPASTGGQFTGRIADRTDIDLDPYGGDMARLADQSPVQIDTVLAGLYAEHSSHAIRAANSIASLRRGFKMPHADTADVIAAGLSQPQWGSIARSAQRSLEQAAAVAERMRPYNDEFKRRGGWTRAFLVSGIDGHVHTSMDCSTCNRMGNLTRFQWLPEYSGADEATIVADAGWRACTVCYPSAPLGVTTTKMFSDEERQAQAGRAEREAAKAAREAKKIAAGLTPDGSVFVVRYVERGARSLRKTIVDGTAQNVVEVEDRPRTEHFQTERSAVIWATDSLAYGPDADKAPAIREIAEAVARKHGRTVEDVLAEFEAKAARKARG